MGTGPGNPLPRIRRVQERTEKFRDALSVGLRSVWANAVPMVVLWAIAVALVLAYHAIPAVAAALEPISRWQTAGGWGAAFLNRVVFCGLLPGVFMVTVPSIRPPRVGWVVLTYCLWGGLWGVIADGFFTLQQAVFGAGTDSLTLVAKTAVDQFVWNMIICTPVNAVFFAWVSRDFKPGPSLNGRTFLKETCLPMLVSNWIVFIPVTVVTYAFPLPLQIQLGGFVGAFWMLVALHAAAVSGRRS